MHSPIGSSPRPPKALLSRTGPALLLAATLLLGACQSNQKGNSVPAAATVGQNVPPWELAPKTGPLGLRDSYRKVDTSLPLVALTFDDGPHPQHTPRLLDILAARNVKATFYVVGTNAKRYPDLLRRMIAEGHEIGNHTVTHGNLTKMSSDAVRRELSVSHQTITEATGVAPRSMRPPYGAITTSQKAWIKREYGYPTIMWSVDPEDWKKPGVSAVTNRLVSGARPGGILLVHDIHKPSVDAIPATLDQLLGRGFQFVTVSQLIAMERRGGS